MEWIACKLQWLIDHPEVTWSGAGITILGILYFIIKRIIFSMRNLCKLSGAEDESKKNIADNNSKVPSLYQHHSGTGDNVGRDKIIRKN